MTGRGAFLAGLFVLAVPVFSWVQWSPDGFVHARLLAAGVAETVRFESVRTTLHPGLRLEGVSASMPGGLNIRLDNVWLRPAWLQLLQGKLAAHVCGRWQGQDMSLTLSSSGDGVALRDIEVTLDSALLEVLWNRRSTGLNLSPRGVLMLRGGADISMSAMPTWADIRMDWRDAKLGMGETEQELGDYTLTLNSADGPWQWSLEGGTQLAVSGGGTLQPVGTDLRRWGLQGSLTVTGKDRPGEMLALISGGQRRATATLSGRLVSPRIQWRK